ncbi:MAG: ATP-binding cassette domain-containing protein [Chloroflexota bacterium]
MTSEQRPSDETRIEEPPLSDAELEAADRDDSAWEQEMERRHKGGSADRRSAVSIRDLGIRYNLRLTRRTTLKQSLAGLVRRSEDVKQTHFWAIRNLDFDIHHGDNLAVVGPNGAGKTTLLLALAGILAPSEGEVEMFGGTSTLLTIGAGFDGELTGRDNIDLAGAFLGIPHQEMARVTPEIVDFADIGPFIDAPLRTYSTGMKARLGFSIATSIVPDILLLDEVLGTGDQTFRAKSQARIRELIKTAKAVVVVTHDLGYVTEFCNRAILMERGSIVAEGSPAEIVSNYRERVRERKLIAESEAKRFASGTSG